MYKRGPMHVQNYDQNIYKRWPLYVQNNDQNMYKRWSICVQIMAKAWDKDEQYVWTNAIPVCSNGNQ